MKYLGFILAFLLGGVVSIYTPAADYMPPKDQVVTSVRNAAPFLDDWLPNVAIDAPVGVADANLKPDTSTTQFADVQANQTDSLPLLTRLSVDDIAGFLTDLDLPYQPLQLQTGESYIAVERLDAFSFYLRPRRCEGVEGCAGLQMFSTFTLDVPREQLAELNDTYALVKFYMDMDGYLVLETHLSTDYGVSRENVRAHIDMFVTVLDTFSETLQTEPPESEGSDIESSS